ncbi:hypothetical protein P167DRAFT_574402 [Morchella conica CCBAS932]|uniref:Uncharacterized protein n=1 Tax=Morchella conica CCBAS932 TaxID=1392247 RepID=A0A3N4L2Y8_9PEZI|nr:hypothetical protein P167DRAFT_574402 [Morchella conica CCBAS932]
MHRHILIKRYKPRRVQFKVTRRPRKTEAEHFLELERQISDFEHRIETNQIQIDNIISDFEHRVETNQILLRHLMGNDPSYAATTSSSSSSRGNGGYAQYCSASADGSQSSRRRRGVSRTRFTEHLDYSDMDFDDALIEAAFSDYYAPEERGRRIKLDVNGEPWSEPRKLCVVGEIPEGCEELVEDLRRFPENTYLLAELRKLGYKVIADPLYPVRHRCWCPTCAGGWNRGVGCCAVTVVARFGDGGDNSHRWA